MNLALFITIVLVSFVVVRIGAVAFNLTGMQWGQAKFQALSCFSGTGFTTREAELIVSHPQRRRIASILMVLGNAGLVTLIATFANSIRSGPAAEGLLSRFLHRMFPTEVVPLVNLLIIVLVLFAVFKLFTNASFLKRLTKALRREVLKRELVKPASFEELLVATGGYGVSGVLIGKENPLRNKRLLESGLRERDLVVLAIEREGETLPNPPAQTEILPGDRLVCFGKLENIREEVVGPPAKETAQGDAS